jgi:hypothetical protein
MAGISGFDYSGAHDFSGVTNGNCIGFNIVDDHGPGADCTAVSY